MSEPDHERRLVQILRASPTVMHVLSVARELDFPDWRLVAGAVYQTVWNHLTGRPQDHGIKDYDLVYFDPDPSWDAEDVFIRRAAETFGAPLADKVEVRNQGRVHLWYESRFGRPYSPLGRTDDMLARFVCPAFAVGVRLEPDQSLSVAAPFGFDDLFALRLRPNPRWAVTPAEFARAMASLKARWPEVDIVEQAS